MAAERKRFLKTPLAVAILTALQTSLAQAVTATSTFSVSLTINAACVINSAGNMTFPASGVLTSAVTATSTINVQCTNSVPYTVGLNQGTASGATVTTRKLTSGSNTINYSLCRDSGCTANWGNTAGIDTASGTGNGSSQAFTVYGSVPAQTTPAAGTYTDTITVTVAY